MRRLGVHTSIAGGVHLSIKRAGDLGCTTLQIFSHNPRQWAVSDISEESALLFRQARTQFGIDPVFVHSSYLINLSAPAADILGRSVTLLARELDLADTLGAEYVILHTGSTSREEPHEGRKRAVQALHAVSGLGTWKARILLENTAGEKGDISSRIADLAEIASEAGSVLVGGICLDTCHAFQAGYDLRSQEGVSDLSVEIDRWLGPGAVKLVHLNDSKRPLGRGVDRHEHIGEGEIGLKGLRNVLLHPRFAAIPVVLETPKKDESDDARNLGKVRALFS